MAKNKNMKKVLILLLLTTVSYSQNIYVSAGFDIRNALVGSNPTQNKPALDYIVRFGMIGNIPNHISVLEAQIGYERFEAIDFDRLFFGIGFHLYPFKNITLVSMLEPSLIGRWGNWAGGLGDRTQVSSHLTVGVSLALRYEISDKFSIEAQSGLMPRSDLNAMYLGDNYIVNNSLSVLYRL